MQWITIIGQGVRRWLERFFLQRRQAQPLRHRWALPAPSLRRLVRVDVYLPASWNSAGAGSFSLLLVNDGQDLPGMGFDRILQTLEQQKSMRPIIAIGVHAGNRMEEYGTANRPDYLGRGKRSGNYQRFILRHLLPLLRRHYPIEPGSQAVAGFSLGGLSAFDMAWRHPNTFGTVGVFSGALWWRSKPFRPKAPDADRIAHTMVEAGPKPAGLRFWFQAGTADEKADRNGNGIIDAIDDTLQLMARLRQQGYQPDTDLRYTEIHGGRHEPSTWAKAFPDFLQWAFPPSGDSRPPGTVKHFPQGNRRSRQA